MQKSVFRFFIALFLLCPLVGCITSWKLKDPPTHEVSFDASAIYTPARGFIQTPKGGAPGTTTLHRPDLREVDLDRMAQMEASGTAKFKGHGLYARGWWGHTIERSTLYRDLVSHNQSFTAGTDVRVDLDLSWWTVGYSYDFVFEVSPDMDIAIIPMAEFYAFRYHYILEGSTSGIPANRKYGRWTVRGGAEVQARLKKVPLTFSLLLISAPPIPNTPILFSAQVKAKYRLVEKGPVKASLFLGLGYEMLRYKDNQEIPNYLKIDYAPMVSGGMEIKFGSSPN